jgi:hypothetical protein
MQSSFTTKQLDRRAATIMRGVRTGIVTTKSDSIRELIELTEALSDQPVKPVVVARLTVTRQNGVRTIVEVWSNATFNSFYRFFHQDGARRSTKRLIRTSWRNEGISWIGFEHLHPAGLETIAKRLAFYASQSNPVVKSKLRIIQRKAYRRLLRVSPDQLGLTKMSRLPIYSPTHS